MSPKKSTKERLLSKALILFVRQGYERTTLKDIARAVGIQAPSIYYYFKSKKDILHRLYEMNWNTFQRVILQEMKECTDPEERIRIYIRKMIRLQFQSAEETVFMDSLSKKYIKARKTQDRIVFDLIRDALREIGASRGPGKTTDPTVAALTGRIDVRFADTTLIDLATDGTPVDLAFGYTLSASAKVMFAAHEVYLPKPKLAVEGPGGVQASFDFQGAKTETAGQMLTVTLTNDLDGTDYA